LRHNLNQTRDQEKNDRRQEGFKAGADGSRERGKIPTPKDSVAENREGKGGEEIKNIPGICKRCGKVGHKSEECFKPLVCPRCKKEGHVARACPEFLPWECIAPFCGLAAPELGFHVIQDEDIGEASKETANIAVITIKEGDVTARQIEGEFKAQAGQDSTWRWYAKKIAEKKFQMKFPTAKKSG
jgi:predicted Zn-ribbon and HTH transcriptional regulator